MIKTQDNKIEESPIKIRRAKDNDFAKIWEIFKEVSSKGDTYVNGKSLSQKTAYDKWFSKEAKTYVAIMDNKVAGAYLIRNNHPDRGSHIANCSYIVDQNYRKGGVGKALAAHSIDNAKKLGYLAIQFNFVVSTNIAAVNLWQKSGFRIIGTIPNGFDHKELGLVDAYIMYLEL